LKLIFTIAMSIHCNFMPLWWLVW